MTRWPPQDCADRGAAQHVEVVDAVAAGEHAVDHGQQLGARMRAGRAALLRGSKGRRPTPFPRVRGPSSGPDHALQGFCPVGQVQNLLTEVPD
jgi:hypothetical protein